MMLQTYVIGQMLLATNLEKNVLNLWINSCLEGLCCTVLDETDNLPKA